MLEKSTCFIKIENVEDYEHSKNAPDHRKSPISFEFTHTYDMMIAEVLLEQLKDSIEEFKTRSGDFDGISKQNYLKNKSLLSKFLKCQDQTDKESAKRQLVSFLFLF